MSIRLESLTGLAVVPYLPALAELRIALFTGFPWLYDGSFDFERQYLSTYAQSPRSQFVLAFRAHQLIGCATGIPLADEIPALQAPFIAAGIDVSEVYYFGESGLFPKFRGRGLGKTLFRAREAHARQQGCFRYCAFCVVERPLDHPLRPADYQPQDGFWQALGFAESNLIAQYSWKDIDQPAPTAKPMRFWLKALE